MATNNITDKNTLKGWFKRGMKPLEAQFHSWMDSYWHKDEKIPSGSVHGLEATLNNKAETSTVEEISKEFGAHENNPAVHKTAEEQSKLDHLAEDPDATYATKEEVQELENNPDIIIFPADLLAGYNSLEENLKVAVTPYIENGTFFTKPVFMKYLYKDDYTLEGNEKYILIAGTPFDIGGQHGVRFRNETKFTDPDYPDDPLANDISIYVDMESNEVKVKLQEYKPEVNTVIAIEHAIFPTTEDNSTVTLFFCNGLKTVLQAIDAGKEYLLFFNLGNNLVPAYFEKRFSSRSGKTVITVSFKAVLKKNGVFVYKEYTLKTPEFVYTAGMDLIDVEATVVNTESLIDNETMFLYENGDGVITVADTDSSDDLYPAEPYAWEKFKDALKSGNQRIMIMLKTKDSGLYCPVAYQLKWNEEAKGFEGKLSIQYLTETEKIQYLCVNDYVFDSSNGYFNGSDSQAVPLIKRYALNVPEVVRFTVNLKDMDERDGIDSEAIEASLIAQAEKIVDWSKTVELLLLDGNGNGGGPIYSATLISKRYLNNSSSISLKMVFKTPSDLLNKLSEILKFTIRINKDTWKATCSITDDWSYNPEIFHLHENNDNVISASDGQKGGDWSSLNEELKRGNQPVVFLKSPTSEYECPVRYSFIKNADGTMPGMMEIFYPKSVDGQWQLWIERRHFSNGCGEATIYAGETSSSEGPEIIKTKLSDSLSPVVELVSEYPTDLSTYVDGTLFIKQQIS